MNASRPMGSHRVQRSMGSVLSICTDGKESAGGIAGAFALADAIEQRFSAFVATSEISQLREGLLNESEISIEMREVWSRCDALKVMTDGVFDAWRNGWFDPTGFVKGWAVDLIAMHLDAIGSERFCINHGGDVRVVIEPGGSPWMVGISDPLAPSRLVTRLRVDESCAIATSGTYYRGAHIDHPLRSVAAAPADGRSVTIIGSQLATADALATAIFAEGVTGLRWMGLAGRHEALLVDGDSMRWTNGAARYLEPAVLARSQGLDTVTADLDVAAGSALFGRADHGHQGDRPMTHPPMEEGDEATDR